MNGYEIVWNDKKQKMVKRKVKEKSVDRLVGVEEEKEVSEEMLKKYIKNAYFRVNDFNVKTLKRELPIPRNKRDITVDVYIEFMEDYLNRIKHGRLPNKSYFLAAPDSFGKKVFAYQVIKESLVHRIEPTPILSTHELYSLLDNKEYVQFYGRFKEADLGIVTMGGAPTRTDLIVVKTVLEYCEREGKPLLILSRFEPEMFHKWDPLSSLYIGVNVSRKGDFGVTELKGFNRENMTKIRKEFSKGLSNRDLVSDFVTEKREIRGV